MRSLLVFFLFFSISFGEALAVPFWGDKESKPVGTKVSELKPGEFVWGVAQINEGPVNVIVSLDEQRAYVYRNGVLVGYSTVSTGKKGHRTPTGVFTILQLDKDHHSSIYNNAAMPYTERLTWGGISLHAGGLPGYPSSHGCIHLPSVFAKNVFAISSLGMTVVIADEHSAPQRVDHPHMVLPIDPATGSDVQLKKVSSEENFTWNPSLSPEGPVSILVSVFDRQIFVYRNGVEIGQASITLQGELSPFGTHTFLLTQRGNEVAHWVSFRVPGHFDADATHLDNVKLAQLQVPKAFQSLFVSVLTPGATMVITEESALKDTTGQRLRLVTADPQGESLPSQVE